MSDIPEGKFRCEMCGGLFDLDPDPAVPLAELRATFGDVAVEDCAQVCDECYEKVKPANNPHVFEAWLIDELTRRWMETPEYKAEMAAWEDRLIWGTGNGAPPVGFLGATL